MDKAPLLLGILAVAAAAVLAAESSREANLTLVNDCNYPVWPMVIPNDGSSAISGNTARLDSGGGAASFSIPPSSSPWSGQVVARAGCAVETPRPSRCASGEQLPATVVQLQVHAYGRADMAVYSVSLSGGFNVPATVTPHAFPSGSACPVLGCTEDLNPRCPAGRRVTAAWWRAGATRLRGILQAAVSQDPDVERRRGGRGAAVRRARRAQVIFCPKTMVTANAAGNEPEAELLRAAVADA
jgi:hypothetical protein